MIYIIWLWLFSLSSAIITILDLFHRGLSLVYLRDARFLFSHWFNFFVGYWIYANLDLHNMCKWDLVHNLIEYPKKKIYKSILFFVFRIIRLSIPIIEEYPIFWRKKNYSNLFYSFHFFISFSYFKITITQHTTLEMRSQKRFRNIKIHFSNKVTEQTIQFHSTTKIQSNWNNRIHKQAFDTRFSIYWFSNRARNANSASNVYWFYSNIFPQNSDWFAHKHFQVDEMEVENLFSLA